MHAENFKDVIISQPPAMYGKAHNIPLENFKGILLCEKPSADGFSVPQDSKAFVPANRTGNPLGYGPTDEHHQRRAANESTRARNVKQHENQNRQYLSRHKKWLYSFAKQMRRMKEEEIEKEVEMARRAAKLRQVESTKREEKQKAQEPAPYDIQQVQTQLSKSKKDKKAAAKPKWAMTEEEAFLAEDHEHDDLLNFAEKLDYDKYIQNYTTEEALEVMRDRVNEIVKANDWSQEDIERAAERDDDDDLRSAVTSEFQQRVEPGASQPQARKALPGISAAHDRDWDATTSRGQILKRAISRDALALAERILENTPSMQKIHTRQSLARVLQKCALSSESNMSDVYRRNAELGGMGTSELAAATAIGPPLEAAPTTVKVSAESTALEQPQGRRILVDLQRSKEKTQNLPYLYRCPAI